MNLFKGAGLTARSILISLGMILVYLAVFLWFATIKTKESVTATMQKVLEEKSALVGADIERVLASRVVDVAIISQAPVFNEGGPDVIKSYLDLLNSSTDLLSAFYFLNPEGALVAGTTGMPAPPAEGEEATPPQMDSLVAGTGTYVSQAASASAGEVIVTEALDLDGDLGVFFCAPVNGPEGIVGVLVAQFNMGVINDIIAEFDAAIIGEKPSHLLDKRGRVIASADKSYKRFATLTDLKDNKDLKAAIKGKLGHINYTDSKGDPVMAGYADLAEVGQNKALDWTILAVAPQADITAPAAEMQQSLLAFVGIGIIVAIVVIGLLTRIFIIPLAEAQKTELRQNLEELQANQDDMKRAAEEMEEMRARETQQAEEQRRKATILLDIMRDACNGYLNREVTVQGDDAIGMLGAELGTFLKNMRESVSTIAANAEALTQAASELLTVGNRLTENTEETTQLSSEALAAAQQIRDAMQSVSSNVEEVSTKTGEIRNHTEEASSVTENAARLGETTNVTISNLGKSSTEIGNVMDVIKGIAEQTNLLALNATIEAASAGDAGKGFAVVASEVKNLAKQTAEATGGISDRIQAIQTETQNSEKAIKGISSIIEEINSIQTTVAFSIQEQSDAIMLIGDRVRESAEGNEQIAGNLARVDEASRNAATCAVDINNASARLAGVVSEMQGVVTRFHI